MPIYEYRCNECGHRLEELQRLSDPPLETCPSCGGGLKKLISAPAFQFKGTGWYVTDYANKKRDGSESSADSGSSGSSSGESSSSESSPSESSASAASQSSTSSKEKSA